MKQYLLHDEWSIVEEGFRPDYNRISESVFSIGNGQSGQRANFEEAYSGDSLQGSYIAGVYYPDKTRVGWWKIGYPEYFAKVLNAPNWICIDLAVDGEPVDLATCSVEDFRRELNMKAGYLKRRATLTLANGKRLRIESTRFLSLADDEVGAIRYSVTALNFSAAVSLGPCIDGDVHNEDSNYGEQFWAFLAHRVEGREAYLTTQTKKTAFGVCHGTAYELVKGQKAIEPEAVSVIDKPKCVGHILVLPLQEGEQMTLYKYAGIVSSLNYPEDKLEDAARAAVRRAREAGFEALLQNQAEAWASKWEEADIVIEGDVAAQQGIRFNIFQLYQTYTGEDARLNIGPKGFTGEKYGGSTYWDTEAYCLPFYLATADQHVARNLLLYRYNHLEKAIENAEKLGFTRGAALYPMVTMNGEECHNEWEITFEEIHRNGAIAYAIYSYINYTGDDAYLASNGLEVLIGIARFWAQRVHYSERKGHYVMHGVTGPNEYENNVNNNWYTSYIARWCLQYTLDSLKAVRQADEARYQKLMNRLKCEEREPTHWQQIIDGLYLPEEEGLGIFVQHDGFLEKEALTVADLKPEDRPLNQNWSWDRILRSVFIKQADVLQGLYFFEDHFDEDTHRRNFDYYEPRTVHESSLSPCIHSILAAKLGRLDKAYEMYLRTARLDLDDVNNDTEDGCHITSMAGTWMAVVQGFGGMRVQEGKLAFAPILPPQWRGYTFKVRFRGQVVEVKVKPGEVVLQNHDRTALSILLYGQARELEGFGSLRVDRP